MGMMCSTLRNQLPAHQMPTGWPERREGVQPRGLPRAFGRAGEREYRSTHYGVRVFGTARVSWLWFRQRTDAGSTKRYDDESSRRVRLDDTPNLLQPCERFGGG